MKNFVEYIGSLVVCSLALGVFQYGDAGKTIKLPYYDVTFGSWPLMEVSKRGTLFKSRRHPPNPKGPPGRGPPGRGPPGNKGGGPGGFRLGPPPPGKLVLVNPGDKGSLHQHLQANLKHFANKKPVNLKLPIIVKAPGPHPPPPPPGYKLGHPNGPPPDGQPIKITDSSSWKPGPPNPSQGDYGHKESGRKSRLFSVLKNAAYSSIFNNGFDMYRHPDFYDERPLPGPYITTYSDGSQVSTFLNEGVTAAQAASRGVERKPSPAPVLSIGGELPENYTVIYAQRQVVGLKSPDKFENSGHVHPGSAEYNAAFKLGGNYEQGHGPEPPMKPPLLIQTFQKRGDDHVVEKLVHQELPDTGLTMTTSVILQTPNISAPLNGSESPHFKQALEDKKRMLKYRKKEKPLDAQVKLLGRLFTKLQRIKPPTLVVADEEHGGSQKDAYLDYEDEDGWKKKAKSKVDSPVMAVQIQTYSAPEIDSTDPDIVESMAEFGTHDVEFAETDELVNLMETLMNQGSSRVNMRDLGSNTQEINDNILNWVRHHLDVTRSINHQAHSRIENVASKQFRQYQTFVTNPGGGNGWGPVAPEIVDPKVGRRSIPLTNTNSMAAMTPPPIFRR